MHTLPPVPFGSVASLVPHMHQLKDMWHLISTRHPLSPEAKAVCLRDYEAP